MPQNCREYQWSDTVNWQKLQNKIVPFTAVFILLLCSLQLLQYCWNSPSCVSVFYGYFVRNSVFFIGILSVFKGKFGLCNIFETQLAALNVVINVVICYDNYQKRMKSRVSQKKLIFYLANSGQTSGANMLGGLKYQIIDF